MTGHHWCGRPITRSNSRDTQRTPGDAINREDLKLFRLTDSVGEAFAILARHLTEYAMGEHGAVEYDPAKILAPSRVGGVWSVPTTATGHGK
jgi:hypothetical protein